MSKQIGMGAEAVLTLTGDIVRKERLPKRYRISNIDDTLRKSRTRKEAKILSKLRGISPRLISTDNQSIIEMEYLDGELVRDVLDDKPNIAEQIGKAVTKMHNANIAHGDLTTSNMILTNSLNIIDFGLSFTTYRIEDFAVDLHLFEEAVESKHYANKEEIWKKFIDKYTPKNKTEILRRLKEVQSRGRNKEKY